MTGEMKSQAPPTKLYTPPSLTSQTALRNIKGQPKPGIFMPTPGIFMKNDRNLLSEAADYSYSHSCFTTLTKSYAPPSLTSQTALRNTKGQPNRGLREMT